MITFTPLNQDENEANLIALLSENQEEEKNVPAEKNIRFSLALYDNDL